MTEPGSVTQLAMMEIDGTLYILVFMHHLDGKINLAFSRDPEATSGASLETIRNIFVKNHHKDGTPRKALELLSGPSLAKEEMDAQVEYQANNCIIEYHEGNEEFIDVFPATNSRVLN